MGLHILKIHIFAFCPLIRLYYPHEEVNFLFLLHGPSQSDDSPSLFLNGLRFGFVFAVYGFGFGSVCLNLAFI